MWSPADERFLCVRNPKAFPGRLPNPQKTPDFPGNYIRITMTGWHVLAAVGSNMRDERPSWASIETTGDDAGCKRDAVMKWDKIWAHLKLYSIEPRPGRGKEHLTNLRHPLKSPIWNCFPALTKSTSRKKSYRGYSGISSQSNKSDTTQKPLTDPEPEPIREEKQEPRSVPVEFKPELKPTDAEQWAMGQMLLHFCKLVLAAEIVFRLTWKLKALGWNQAAFVRYMGTEHHLERYDSPMAGLENIILKWFKHPRGPVLESYPPPKPAPRAVADDPLPAEHSPPELSPVVDSPKVAPRVIAASPPIARVTPAVESLSGHVSYDRMDELLAGRNVPNARFYDWMNEGPHRWPRSEDRALRLIERYLARARPPDS